MKYAFAAVYVLVLATQLPHIWHAYASLENPGIPLAQWTALGAAVAFEASIGIFTYRIIKGSRRRWTRWGLYFFILASIVANGYYYEWWPAAFARLMPAFATLALPVSLALFAEEFGAEVKREERAAKRLERKTAEPPANTATALANDARYRCQLCEYVANSQQGLNAHQRVHSNHKEEIHAR